MCRVLVEEIFPRYGVPIQVISDQGRKFDNRLVKVVCQVMEADKMPTSSYKFSTNVAVERCHRTLNAMLGDVVCEAQRDWDERVRMAMAAYRASRHEATGYSTNYLMFGREVRASLTWYRAQ